MSKGVRKDSAAFRLGAPSRVARERDVPSMVLRIVALNPEVRIAVARLRR